MSAGHNYMTMLGSYQDVMATYKKGDLEETIMLCNYYIDFYENMEVSFPMPGIGDNIPHIQSIKNYAESGITYSEYRKENIITNIIYFVFLLIIAALFIGIIYGLYLGLSQVYDWLVS